MAAAAIERAAARRTARTVRSAVECALSSSCGVNDVGRAAVGIGSVAGGGAIGFALDSDDAMLRNSDEI